jgi:hypothetical protein
VEARSTLVTSAGWMLPAWLLATWKERARPPRVTRVETSFFFAVMPLRRLRFLPPTKASSDATAWPGPPQRAAFDIHRFAGGGAPHGASMRAERAVRAACTRGIAVAVAALTSLERQNKAGRRLAAVGPELGKGAFRLQNPIVRNAPLTAIRSLTPERPLSATSSNPQHYCSTLKRTSVAVQLLLRPCA